MDTQSLGSVLARVHQAAKKYGGTIVPSRDIERTDRELLVRTKWLQEIIRGWYMLVRPDILPGDTSAWYANFWDFVRIYLAETYGTSYCLSAENSIDLHLGNPTIPKQVIAIVEKRGGNLVSLPFNTSILVYPDPKNFPPERSIVRDIQVMSLPYALCKTTPTFFHQYPFDAEIALRSIQDLQGLIYVLATYNFVRAAERIVGAFQHLHETEKADLIVDGLKKLGMSVKAADPFQAPSPIIDTAKFRSPYGARIYNLWAHFRPIVLQHFPPPPGIRKDPTEYLIELESLYLKDAYNSLSIEGYHVSPELIERVHQEDWNPDLNSIDHEQKDALAARGYYEVFLEVKKAIAEILNGQPPGKIIAEELQNWFQKLFSPSVQAGILKPNELLGYRRHQVFIRNSRHVPLPKEALLDAMETFFDCLRQEKDAGVRAVLGHFFFVYIHPYMDGNGRLGRFIMNAMLASGGYPWTVIQVKNRSRYFSALEQASVDQKILPFILFIVEEMQQTSSTV